MATAVEKAIDVAADAAEIVAEESTDVAVATRSLGPRDVGLFFGGFGVGAIGGFLIGGWVLSKRLIAKYEAIADEEIEGMKAHYDSKLRALENEKEKRIVSEVLRETKDKIEAGKDGGGQTPYYNMYDGKSPPEESPETETPPVVQNVFVDNSDEDVEVEMTDAWDAAEELASRVEGVPYIVHRNEHEEGPEGPEEYEKYTLTYFEGDDVLCREDDTIIEDQDDVVGLGNLSRFGHGSGDPNIVYIRNDKLKVDLEVVHSDGKYATEVAGFKEDELQHSSMRRRSPRRSEYDADG